MTPAELDLARRAVACPALRGRAPTDDPRWTGGSPAWRDGHGVLWRHIDDGREWLPDLTDPATLGCIEFGILAPLGITVGPWRARLWVDAEPVTDWTGLGRAHAVVEALEAACQE